MPFNFKRGQDPNTSLDIGANSSYFWPKPYEELTPKEQEEAFEKNPIEIDDWGLITDDDYILEPPDSDMRALFGDEFYSRRKRNRSQIHPVRHPKT